MTKALPVTAARVEDGAVTFGFADPGHRCSTVRLLAEIGLTGDTEMSRCVGGWHLAVQVPEHADRFEYLLEVEDRRGRRTTLPDPSNPLRAPGAFGDKSVVLLPGYRAPSWLEAEVRPGHERPIDIDAPALPGPVTGSLWCAPGLDDTEPAPLLVVHDGPEYDRFASLTRYLGAGIASGRLPPLRAALLAPGDRNRWYSANPAYAAALAGDVLPALEEAAPSTARIALGASLGALALLHAHERGRGLFDAMMLQSGSYFTARTDPQERRFSGFATVTAFVRELRAAGPGEVSAVPVVLTCGLAEENLANNRETARTLAHLGYEVELVEVRDAHNFTAWRDALDPHLTDLVAAAVSERAA